MIRINKNLALFSGLILLLGILSLFIFQRISPLIGHVAYYCQTLLIETNMVAIPYYLSAIPFVLLFITVMIAFIRFFAFTIKVQTLKFSLRDKEVFGKEVHVLVESMGLKNKVILIKSDKQFAYCLGIRNPKIYFSTGLQARLTLKELEAVLRHEQYHLENHDTVISVLASVAYSLFPFFPLVGDLIRKYRIDREIEADKFAVSKTGTVYPLISTLKKLLAVPTTGNVAVVAIAIQDTLEPRIYSLVNKPYVRRQFRIHHLLITLFSLLIMASILMIPVQAKELHNEKHDVIMLCTEGQCMNSCSSKKNLDKFYSEMPYSKTTNNASSHLYSPAH